MGLQLFEMSLYKKQKLVKSAKHYILLPIYILIVCCDDHSTSVREIEHNCREVHGLFEIDYSAYVFMNKLQSSILPIQ